MIRFNCDYSEGAHEKIMERLMQTNMEQTPGYGEDMCDIVPKSPADMFSNPLLRKDNHIISVQMHKGSIEIAIRILQRNMDLHRQNTVLFCFGN